MTSRKSSSDLSMIFATIKRNIWLLVLAVIGYLFSMPVATAVMQQSRITYLKGFADTSPELLEYQLKMAAESLCQVFYRAGIIITVFGAVLAAIVLFLYLTNKKQIDLYHSLPVKRGRLFAINYISGFLIFLIPFIICLILNAAVICGLGYGTYLPWATYFALALKMILSFFCIYSMMIFAMNLSGTVIMSLLLVFAMNAVCPIVRTIHEALNMYFYETYSSMAFAGQWNYYTSPFLNAMTSSAEAVYCLILFAVGVITLALALFCYKKRSSEAAGVSLAFKSTKHIIRVPLTLLASLVFGICFYMAGNYNVIWLYFGAVVGAVLIGQFLQIWIEGEFAAAKKSWITVIATAVIACGIFSYAYCDLGNYDTYLPDAEKVQSAQIEMTAVNSYTTYTYDSSNLYDQYNSNDFSLAWEKMKFTDPETIDAILKLAQNGIENLDGYTDYTDPQRGMEQEVPEPYFNGSAKTNVATEESEVSSKNTTHVTVVYNMGHGKKVYRQYANIDVDAVKGALIQVINDPEYQSKYSAITSADLSHLFARSIDNFKSHSASAEMANLSNEQHQKLIDAYIKDFQNLRGETISSEIPVGQIELALFTDKNNYPQTAEEALKATNNRTAATDNKYSFFTQNYPIYPSFTETISVIKEYFGDDFFDDDIANIKSIDISYNDDYGVDYDEYGNALVDEETLYKRYVNSDQADNMTYEEFIKKYGTQPNPSITDPVSIMKIMESTKDSAAVEYSVPFFQTGGQATYTVNYENGNTTDRVKLIK